MRTGFALALAAIVSLGASASAEDRDLRSRFDRLLSVKGLRTADVGVSVRRLGETEPLVAIHEDRPLAPASNMKIVATAAALDLLGRDYVFVTRFLMRGEIVSGGVLEGDLAVVGGGDPEISGRATGLGAASRLDEAARAIRDAGVARVSGRLVLDDRFLDRELVNPGWPKDQLGEWYCAETGALSLNDNCLDVTVSGGPAAGAPPVVTLDPDTAYVEFRNEATTTASRGEHVYRIERRIGENRFALTGKVLAGSGPAVANVTVHDPTLYFGTVFREALSRAGVAVDGVTVVEDRTVPLATPPGREVFRLETSLVRAVEVCNKRSQNFYAEQIVKTVGRERRAEGSWRAGLAEVAGFLERLGVGGMDAGEALGPAVLGRERGEFRLLDGSGLSAENRLSPRALTRVLEHMVAVHPARKEFFDSLPIGGVDASLEKRMRDRSVAGRVVAKTGYISRVSALSGYVRGRNGSTYAFSFLFNRFRGSNSEMKAVQDALCAAIVDWSGGRAE